jgi:hypothetical protein
MAAVADDDSSAVREGVGRIGPYASESFRLLLQWSNQIRRKGRELSLGPL